jgi:Electron transfer DM13
MFSNHQNQMIGSEINHSFWRWEFLIRSKQHNDMKKILFLLITLFVISCSEDDNTPTGPVNDSFDPMGMDVTLLKQGTMTGVGHTVSGEIKAYDDNGKTVIVMDPFMSQNGPDLKVYLSTDEGASQYINLGDLKSINGKQSYDVTGMPDLQEYKYVLIWCEAFTVIFGKAELK